VQTYTQYLSIFLITWPFQCKWALHSSWQFYRHCAIYRR